MWLKILNSWVFCVCTELVKLSLKKQKEKLSFIHCEGCRPSNKPLYLKFCVCSPSSFQWKFIQDVTSSWNIKAKKSFSCLNVLFINREAARKKKWLIQGLWFSIQWSLHPNLVSPQDPCALLSPFCWSEKTHIWNHKQPTHVKPAWEWSARLFYRKFKMCRPAAGEGKQQSVTVPG